MKTNLTNFDTDNGGFVMMYMDTTLTYQWKSYVIGFYPRQGFLVYLLSAFFLPMFQLLHERTKNRQPV